VWAFLGRWLRQREVWGFVLTALGTLTVISLTTRDQGKLSETWSLALRQAFGVGVYPVALVAIASGLFLMVQNPLHYEFRPRWQAIVGWELLFFFGLGLIHIAGDGSPLALAQQGKRGGYIGWAFWRITVPYLGKASGILLMLALMLWGLFLVVGAPWNVWVWRARWGLAQVSTRWRARIVKRRLAARARLAPATEPARADSSAPKPVGAPGRPRPARAVAKLSSPVAEPPFLHAAAPEGALPSLDMLTPDTAADRDDVDARHRAQIIEETLAAFGVPAQVVEWSRGPVVTQFGVEPGFVERSDHEGNLRRHKMRVNKILSLQNDLALALAAAPIRIEAPVPGRAMVGIEVPNDTKALVGLRDVLESPQFCQLRSNLRIALGRDVSGAPVVTDLSSMPHLLIAGATGTGKSICLNSIIVSLLFQNTPEQLRLLLIDPKRVELTGYDGIPHLIAPTVVDVHKVVAALRWTVREMENRYREFARVGARNLSAYNKGAPKHGQAPLPMIVVVIDELADLMLASPEDVERTICRIAQMARATGIHLVIATQRPSVDVVTGLIKANFPARISFAVSSQVDSRVILDTPGAEKLLGRGDMLYMAPDSPKLQRIQGCFVSDQEVRSLVRFWRKRAAPALPDGPESKAPPWDDATQAESEDDDLLPRAIALVRERQHASASFLQRQMRIGYPRAARLIDQLEEAGVVGPAETGGRSRVVLDANGAPLAPVNGAEE
jgi:S-DNA-T family DNA segregation ATPase FtsK/SpoIIIE